jgi:hypothetical protein
MVESRRTSTWAVGHVGDRWRDTFAVTDRQSDSC